MRRRNVRINDETEEIKKGPWKVEEDEVLINHVKKYGPRDWSSIRSKGLLQRTGKSCRLRWVNKLRPNLKNGVKFSAEEEGTVIELQEKFGNKWAKIATYLSGRTDNDVKNFWSSRQKRLKRILHSSTPSSSKSYKNMKEVQFQEVTFDEAQKFSSSTEEESATKSQSCSTSQICDSEMIKLTPLPEQFCPTFPDYKQSFIPLNYELPEKKLFVDLQPQLPFVCPQTQPDFLHPLLGGTNYLDVFGISSGLGIENAQFPIMPSFSSPGTLFQDTIVDDFPLIDMFDHIESLPSPSEWS